MPGYWQIVMVCFLFLNLSRYTIEILLQFLSEVNQSVFTAANVDLIYSPLTKMFSCSILIVIANPGMLNKTEFYIYIYIYIYIYFSKWY